MSLQSVDDLISSNVTEKQTKLDFLGKLITFLERCLEMPINVKPAKIISGLETERTRYLLQLFTVVATTKDLKLGAKEKTNDHDCPKLEPRIEKTASILMEIDKADALPNQDYRGKGLHDVDITSKLPTFTQPTPMTTMGAIKVELVQNEVPLISSLSNLKARPVTSRGARPSVIKEWEIESTIAADIIKPTANIIKDEVGCKFEEMTGAAPRRETVDGTSAQPITQDKLVDEAPLVPSLANLKVRPATARGARPSVIKETEFESIKAADVIITTADIIKDEVGCKFKEMPGAAPGGETTTNNFGNGFRMHQNKPATEHSYQASSTLLPAQLSDIDFQSLARAICHISQSTASIGKYINSLPDNVEKMMKERSRWVAEQHRAEAMHNLR